MKNQPWPLNLLYMVCACMCVCVCVCVIALAPRGRWQTKLTSYGVLLFWEREEDRGVRTMRKQSNRCKKRRSDGQRQMGKNEAEGRRVRWGGGTRKDVTWQWGRQTEGKDGTGSNVLALLFEPAVWSLMLTPTHDPTVNCFFYAHYTSPVTPTSTPSIWISKTFCLCCVANSSLSKAIFCPETFISKSYFIITGLFPLRSLSSHRPCYVFTVVTGAKVTSFRCNL